MRPIATKHQNMDNARPLGHSQGPKPQSCAHPTDSILSVSSASLLVLPIARIASPSPPLLPDHFRTSLLDMIAASRHPPRLNLSEI